MLPTERRSRRRRRKLLPWTARAAAAAVVFAAGIALGQALESDQGSGGTQTYVRTLVPETLPAQTVTVTVPAP